VSPCQAPDLVTFLHSTAGLSVPTSIGLVISARITGTNLVSSAMLTAINTTVTMVEEAIDT
jgi:hypothetical protein